MSMSKNALRACIALTVSAVSASFSNPLHAANGSYLNGWGASNRGIAGAGAALAKDPMVMAVNPAGLAALENSSLQMGLTLFKAKQGFRASEADPAFAGPGALAMPSGKRESSAQETGEIEGIFPIPSMAWNWRVDSKNALGIALYGNGGINTRYETFDNPNCPPGTPGQGYLCFGTTSADFSQLILAPTWATTLEERIRIGISPLLVYQSIELRGLQLFSPRSRDPEALSNRGHDGSFGAGIKLGLQAELSPVLDAGLTLQSRINMQKHKKYAGILANRGELDAPPYFQAGLAWRATNRLTILADYQRIYFSKIAAYSNPGNSSGRFGDSDGPGFGWQDAKTWKLAMEYQANSRTMLRLGYANASRVMPDSELFGSFLALAVFDDHFNGGFSWQYNDDTELEMSFMWVPEQTARSENPLYSGQQLESSNRIFTLDIGLKKRF